jgi:exopolyphosphatase / guanosine-5'-triphosphate,3'-diphosphate pyrophosphatase
VRLASIDLGTNTVRLLVADVEAGGRWRLVHQAQEVTRLGEGLGTRGSLADPAMARTAIVVSRYVDEARRLGAGSIRVVGTSAVREASNGRQFADTIEQGTGARVEIVSGADEARLTVRGVLEGLGRPGGEWLVFDIGGGSTEYTLVRDGAIVTSVSLRLGVVPLTERFPFPGPVESGSLARLSAHIAGRLARELPSGLRRPVERLVGTAGTVTTLAALDLGLDVYDATRVQGHHVDRAGVARQLDRVCALTVAERAALPCLEPGRADLIVPGLAIVVATMDLVRAEVLTVSDTGLREGMLAELIDTGRE